MAFVGLFVSVNFLVLTNRMIAVAEKRAERLGWIVPVVSGLFILLMAVLAPK